MSTEKTSNSTLIVVLSILGVLAIAISAGLLLMQKQEDPGQSIGTAFAFRSPSSEDDGFDPISWAREGVAYPPLEESEYFNGDFVTEYNKNGAIPDSSVNNGTISPLDMSGVLENQPAMTEKKATETENNIIPSTKKRLETQPAALALPPLASEKSDFHEITENAYWVQVFSSADSSWAEGIREELATQGLPTTIQIREINGNVRYRVRLGAFKSEGEAQHYAQNVRRFAGYESSYVVIAPVTRRIPSGS